MRRAAAIFSLGIGACYMQGQTMLGAQPAQIDSVQWNVSSADTGRVSSVAEIADDVVVFSDKGALVFAGGALATVDGTVTAWQPVATSIPAADGTGTWLVAVSTDGRLRRLRGRTALEDVSDRYGLAHTKVTGVASGGGAWSVFSTDTGLAISDGVTVSLLDGALSGLVAGSHRAAGITADGHVRVIDLRSRVGSDYAADHPVAVAFDAAGMLWVETAHKLYTENRGALDPVYEDSNTLHGLTFGGGRLWFAAGTSLGFATKDAVMRAAVNLPFDATLFASTTGDVWAVSQGALSRYGVPVSGDEAHWRKSVLPVYARVCSQCHGPGGSSGIDLSTYGSWAARRQDIYGRVFVQKTMPQNQALTADDSAALQAWTQATP